jgi:membrane protease YdiL (CAAX protease family)
MTTWLIFFAAYVLSGAAEGVARGLSVSPSLWEPLSSWVRHYGAAVSWTLPAIVTAVRARRLLRSIVLGKLSIRGMLVLGVGAGCACVLASNIIGLPYFTKPALNLRALVVRESVISALAADFAAPVGEEMLYQAGLQTWLQRFGPFVAVIGATAPFWLWHVYGITLGALTWPDALTWLLPSMLAFALIRQTTKSLGAAVLAHSTFNVISSVLTHVPR